MDHRYSGLARSAQDVVKVLHKRSADLSRTLRDELTDPLAALELALLDSDDPGALIEDW